MKLPDKDEITSAAEEIYRFMQPSAQLTWPLLNERVNGEIWVKHENHNPTGAFKVRGGLYYLARLEEELGSSITGVCAATRGNHGQSLAFAASKRGIRSVIVVPKGNNKGKNAAMRALGAELIEYGRDFDEAVVYCKGLADREGYHMIPSYHRNLIAGVATYALEMLEQLKKLQRIYVPIGMGSGACGVIAAKQALNHEVEVIGVVSSHADTYAQSLAAGEVVATDSADTLADGLAVRSADATALSVLQEGLAGIVRVTDEEVQTAMADYFLCTHNLAEGAGAASLAALNQDLKNGGQWDSVGIVLSGGNVSPEVFSKVLEQCG